MKGWLWFTAAALAGAFLLLVVLGGWVIVELLGSVDNLGDDLAEKLGTAFPTLFPTTPMPTPNPPPVP